MDELNSKINKCVEAILGLPGNPRIPTEIVLGHNVIIEHLSEYYDPATTGFRGLSWGTVIGPLPIKAVPGDTIAVISRPNT